MHALPRPCCKPGQSTCTRCFSRPPTNCNAPAHAGLQRMTAKCSCSFYVKRHCARATAAPLHRLRVTCTRPSSCCTTAAPWKAAPRTALPSPAWRRSATCNCRAWLRPRPSSASADSAHVRRWIGPGCASCRPACSPCRATIRQPSTAPYQAWNCWVSAWHAASTGNRQKPAMPVCWP
ncbi:hypothetical protein D3C80_1150580 [compost metagenome]